MADETNQQSASATGVSETTATETTKAVPVRDEFDPLGWELPVICKDCDQPFKVPYRHFQAGVVFHCPRCRGSFVPTLPMYRAVREAFETFYSQRKRRQEEFTRGVGDAAKFHRQQAIELENFHRSLEKLARAMRPAGKLVKRKGLGAMFT